MEGRDGAHALDLVDMAARLDQPLPEQRLRRPIAEQEQALRLGEADVPARDLAHNPRGRGRSGGRPAQWIGDRDAL